MVQSIYYEAESCLTSQENPKSHYGVINVFTNTCVTGPDPYPVLSTHTLTLISILT